MECQGNYRFILAFFALFFALVSASASPLGTTYQARIVKPDGQALEAPSVNFKFTVLNPAATCILYAETYSAISMSNTAGIISFTLGSGVKTYPVSATSFAQVFNNSTPLLSCDAGGPPSYSPQSTDIRKVVMQFNDGGGWQTLPAMAINAVPYSIYAGDALRLGGVSATSYVQYSTIPSCTASEALHYSGTSFSCVNLGSGGASATITSGDVTTALGYIPANLATVSTSFTTVTNSLSTVGTSYSTLAASMAGITSSQWTTSGSTINYAAGNVGIGTTAPSVALEVSGSIHASKDISASGTFYAADGTAANPSYSFGAASGTGFSNSSNQIYVSTAGVQRMYFSANGIAGLNVGNPLLNTAGAGATTPPYSFVGDSQTGMYRINAGILGFAVTGTEKMRIDSAGNVGIGVAPESNSRLQVHGGSGFGIIRITNDATGSTVNDGVSLQTSISNTQASLWNYENTPLAIGTNNQEMMRILPSGYVGVGTSAPSVALEVKGSTAANGALRISTDAQSNTSGSQTLQFGTNISGTYVPTGIIGDTSSGDSNIKIFALQGNLQLGANVGGVASTRMTIQSDGNIGVGITDPTAFLHLAAGTSSAASFKLASGTLLASPQSGTIEYDGFNLYYTDGVNARRTIAASTASGSYANVTGIENAAGNINLVPNAAGSVVVSATTASTNSQTGALVVKGGLGVAGNIYSSGTMITSANMQGSSITATSGIIAPYIYGGTGSSGNLVLDSTTHVTKGNILLAPGGGYVGIGTATPSYPLDVQSSSSFQQRILHASDNANDDAAIMMVRQRGTVASATQVLNNDSIGGMYFRAYDGVSANTTNAHIEVFAGQNQTPTARGNVMAFATTVSGTATRQEIMRIHSNGFVAIGNTNPNALLQVGPSGGQAANYNIYTASYNNAAGQGQYVGNWSSTDYWGIGPANIAADKTLRLGIASDRTGTWSGTQDLNLTVGGNVGIGAVNQSEKLHVSGGASGTAGTIARFKGNSGWGSIDFYTMNTSRSFIGDFNVMNSMGWDTASNYLQFLTGGNERVRIDSQGKMGIGTAAPTAKLDVSGAIRIAYDSTACNSGFKGAIRFSSTDNIFEMCDGSAWNNVASADLIPASSIVLMETCPGGWTDTGLASSTGPGAVTCNGVTCHMCQTSSAALVPANSNMLMEACPTGWLNQGKGVSSGLAGYVLGGMSFSLITCKSPANSSAMPKGARLLMQACPASWNDLGDAGAGPQAANCPTASCRVCEVPGGTTNVRLMYGGSASGTTLQGPEIAIIGGRGGSTSGAGGSVDLRGGLASDGPGGVVNIFGGTASTTTSTARAGGAIIITAGNGAVSGAGGGVTISTGLSPDTSTYADMLLNPNGGRVGIGTSSPSARLSLSGTGELLNLTGAGLDGTSLQRASFYADSTNGLTIEVPKNSSGAQLNFNLGWRGGANGMTMLGSNGNVGVGTASPSNNLHISASTNGEVGFRNDNTNAGSSAYSIFRQNSDAGQFVIFTNSSTRSTDGGSAATTIRTDSGKLHLSAGGGQKMTIDPSGNVGIGTSSPTRNLQVEGTSQAAVKIAAGATSQSFIEFARGGSVTGYIGLSLNGGLVSGITDGDLVLRSAGVKTHISASGNADLTIINSGNVGIGISNPSYTLHVVGTAGLSTGTAWTNASDIRLKDIQGDYEYGLNEVLKLHTVRYNYKKENALGLPSDFSKTGFIAQEVQKVIPDAVNVRKDGYLELNVDPIHWAVVNAVKELFYKITGVERKVDRAIASVEAKKADKTEVDALKAENAELKARLERLEKMMLNQPKSK